MTDDGFNEIAASDAQENMSNARQSYDITQSQKENQSYQHKVNLGSVEAKSLIKRAKKCENVYQFARFDLTDLHLKNLDCKGKTLKAWLHGCTIVGYLEIDTPSVYVLEDLYAFKLFNKKEQTLTKIII